MKHRSNTNSRPAEDLDYRREYSDSHWYDELLPYFPTQGCGMVRVPGWPKALPMHGTDADHVHHIFGGRLGRWDRPWNIVKVCSKPVHEWLEDFKTDGRVIGLRFMLDKGRWNEEDCFRCLGRYQLGWIQGVRCEFPFAEAIRMEIVRQIQTGGIKA